MRLELVPREIRKEDLIRDLETIKAKYDNLYLRHQLPSAAEFWRLSMYVDVPTLQKIDDEDLIREMFIELQSTLVRCAEAIGSYDKMVEQSEK